MELLRLVIQNREEWWPQRYPISQVGNSNVWTGKIRFGMHGERRIHIVQANDLATRLLDLHREVTERNEERKRYLRENLAGKELDPGFWKAMPGDYHPIKSGRLPNGLDSLACVTVTVKKPGG